MRNSLFLIFLTFCFYQTEALTQEVENDTLVPIRDTIKRNEIGYSFVTTNSNLGLPFGVNKFIGEILNGILVRHRFKSFILRGYASFHRFETNVDYDSLRKLNYGDVQTKDYSGLVGLQRSFIKKNEYLYAYADIGYLRREQTGTIVNLENGFNPFRLISKGNGIKANLGLGTKLKVFRNIYFSTEICYNPFILWKKHTYIGINSGEKIIHRTTSITNNFLGRIYFSIVF